MSAEPRNEPQSTPLRKLLEPKAGVARDRTASPAAHAPVPFEPDWPRLRAAGAYGRWGKPMLTIVLFALTLPLALALAIPIALINWAIFGDPRRILYCQPRVGYRGKTFWIYKFRTMQEARGAAYDSWRGGDDHKRVTRFGRFLRCTHFDELAQFINVARGEMAFIGPRPEMIEISEWARREIPSFEKRLAVKPGITGFSQITLGYTGVDVEAYRAKLAADEEYCKRMSLGFDLVILARTALWMLCGRGWRWKPRTEPTAATSDPAPASGAAAPRQAA